MVHWPKKTDRIIEDGRTFSYRISDTVSVTQNDVRAIQLAKAALHAGFKLLMDKMEVPRVDRVVLAGAFGTHIDPKYAMVLGMVPDCQLDNVVAAGNSAGAGARMALLIWISVPRLNQLCVILKKSKQRLSHHSKIILCVRWQCLIRQTLMKSCQRRLHCHSVL